MKLKALLKNYWVAFLIVAIAYLAFIHLDSRLNEIEMLIIRVAEAIISRN